MEKFDERKKSAEKKFAMDEEKSFKIEVSFLVNLFKRRKPDIIIVLGDRYEMLAAAATAIGFNIPIIHIFGGAVTVGATDELNRHAITKMSHFHLVAHEGDQRPTLHMPRFHTLASALLPSPMSWLKS